MTTQQSPEPAVPAGSGSPEGEQIGPQTGSAVAVTLDFIGETPAQMDLLLDRLDLVAGSPGLPGSLFQWARSSLDGLRVVEVWETQRHFEYFFAREILPAIDQIGIARPQVTSYEVHSYLTQGPTVAIDDSEPG